MKSTRGSREEAGTVAATEKWRSVCTAGKEHILTSKDGPASKGFTFLTAESQKHAARDQAMLNPAEKAHVKKREELWPAVVFTIQLGGMMSSCTVQLSSHSMAAKTPCFQSRKKKYTKRENDEPLTSMQHTSSLAAATFKGEERRKRSGTHGVGFWMRMERPRLNWNARKKSPSVDAIRLKLGKKKDAHGFFAKHGWLEKKSSSRPQ